MKKKDLKRKLSLHKETISNLNSVFGGGDTSTTDIPGLREPETVIIVDPTTNSSSPPTSVHPPTSKTCY